MKNQKVFAAFSAAVFALTFNFLVTEKWMPQISNLNMASYFSTSDENPIQKNKIQVALLLDTSSSMNGLIEQAKSQLWQILNLLAQTERQDGESDLEIALYEYGNSLRLDGKFQIHQVSEFTTDMDLISERLFELTTNGGNEFCGQVIKTSLDQLEWGQNDNDMKMIYIAGNESFTQGPLHYSRACSDAKKQNISVNTIYCGTCEQGVQGMWKQGAQLGGGEYLCINQNEATVYTETPYDDKINDLNNRLNDTYIPYGKKGKEKIENQKRQDKNASSYSKANSADRAAFKSSKKYKAESWDLVDAYKNDKNVLNNGQVDLTTVSDTLQNLSIEELEAQIENVAAQRAAIQTEIKSLNTDRLNYINENAKKESTDNNLKKSIEKSVENQAKKKGYKIKKQ